MSESARKPIADLDRLSVPELTALITAAEAKRSERMEGAKAELLAEFRDKAAALGVSLDSLVPRGEPAYASRTRNGIGAKVPAKYRNPETGDTWSGRGREPRWLKGKNRATFALKT